MLSITTIKINRVVSTKQGGGLSRIVTNVINFIYENMFDEDLSIYDDLWRVESRSCIHWKALNESFSFHPLYVD